MLRYNAFINLLVKWNAIKMGWKKECLLNDIQLHHALMVTGEYKIAFQYLYGGWFYHF